MRSAMPHDKHSTCYTIREVALILGIAPSRVSNAVRVGSIRTVMRRGRLVIPAKALRQALDGPASTDNDQQFGGGQ